MRPANSGLDVASAENEEVLQAVEVEARALVFDGQTN
jgi:hypothetical protein